MSDAIKPLQLPGPVTPPSPSILEQGLAQVQKALAVVPPGKRSAIVAGVDADGEIFFGAAARINDEWALSADLEWRVKEKPRAQFSVRWAK